MRYIALFMLVCLFFTVRSQEEESGNDVDAATCSFENKKDCKNSKENELTGLKCCWFEGKPKAGGEKQEYCEPIIKKQFKAYYDAYEITYDDLSLDCSGKYLYVASLLLLFFVF